MSEKKPFEIARETLKQLTLQKLSPTPANYLAIYNETAGIPVISPFPADILRDISKSLPVKTPGQQKQRGLLDYAIDRLNWDGVKTALVAYGSFSPLTGGNDVPGVAAPNTGLQATAPALTTEFLSQLGRLIEYTQPALGTDDERCGELSKT